MQPATCCSEGFHKEPRACHISQGLMQVNENRETFRYEDALNVGNRGRAFIDLESVVEIPKPISKCLSREAAICQPMVAFEKVERF